MIDLYCERTSAAIDAEPLNAITNGAFLIAAWFAFILARREKAFDAGSVLLIAATVAIGLGSFAFHTLATYPAMLADTLPILAFQLVFLLFYTSRALRWPAGAVAGIFAAYIATIALFGLLPQGWLNGSVSYLPALLFLIGLGVLHVRAGLPRPHALLIAGAVFALSLTFRSLDNAVCASLPFGVHFLWHMLNAVVLYLSMGAYILRRRGPQ
jgi:hypothetical protein